MTVQIENIQVKNLGPLDSLQAKLGQVNLIYGRNETGKTYLVEFLLGSLFRHAKTWDLRGLNGRGMIQVQGLGPDPVLFSPEKDPKIEDFWEETGRGLPLNLARFLVVKGGELALEMDSRGGVGRDVLKLALTSQALLDGIWDSIGATVREASLEGSQILGANRPPLKTKSELQNEIQDLDELLDKIDGSYSRGPARELEGQIELLQEKLAARQHAKGHLAFLTHKRLLDLESKRAALPVADLQELRDSLRDLKSMDRDLKKLESNKKDAEAQSQDYHWLESAAQIWEEKGLDQKGSPPLWLGIAGLSGIGLGLILLALEGFFPIPEFRWLGGGLALVGFGLSLSYGIRHYRWTDQLEDSRERKSIQKAYQAKFESELAGLADLKSQLARLAKFHILAQTTGELLAEKNQQRDLASHSLESRFLALTGEVIPPTQWDAKEAELSQRSRELDQEITETKIELGKLDVPEEDYQADPAQVDYDPDAVLGLENELKDLTSQLESYQTSLETLKAEACGRLGVPPSAPWREVLSDLQDLVRQKEDEYKELTARIVAQIGLTQVLGRLREEEDLKINQAINAPAVSELLYQITGSYRRLELAGDQLLVYDDLRGYPLAELSTGAREQVQLALRLGIASDLCGGNPLFLILDDAFQHSDWGRREALVESALVLAESGWQILYLTMDDHIRDLFQKKVKPALKSRYKKIDLS